MTPYERLKYSIEASGLTLKEYSEQAGIPYKTLQNYVAGTRKIGLDAMMKMCAHMGLNLNWLLTGEGEMHHNAGVAPAPSNEQELCELAVMLSEEQKTVLLALAKLFAAK